MKFKSFNELPSNAKGRYYRKNHEVWRKTNQSNHKPFCIIYRDFIDKDLLKQINGNSLKLYIFLLMNSKNETGESWYSIEVISKYFNKSPRTISYWLKNLEELNLIKRLQLNFNEESHTFLQPY